MKRPVFVLGCPRSGTTLLYSMLLAAGGFVVYRKETHFYELAPRFPNLSTARSQERFIKTFLQGYLGKLPGLNVEPFVRRALGECRSTGDFLPALMTGLATAQQAERWVEGTPAHLLYIHEIKRTVPDALLVHVIRDGRDCAVSNDRQRWLPMLPWDRRRSIGVAALYWEWMVRCGRRYGRAYPRDYLEVRFEHLIADPPGTLKHVGAFIDHDLDYERIVNNPVHSLRNPNTSFREDRGPGFNPVGRWKEKCSPEDVRLCEELVGSYLEELGYPLAYPEARRRLDARLMRAAYMPHFTTKHWVKTRTPLARFMTSTSAWARQPRAGERLPIPTTQTSISA